MFVLIITIFTLLYYATILSFPITLSGIHFVIYIDIITPFLFFWALRTEKYSFIQKALFFFFVGLIVDIFLNANLYFYAWFYLVMLVFIDNNIERIKNDVFVRVVSLMSIFFTISLFKSAILGILGSVNFASDFLTRMLIDMPLSMIAAFSIILGLVRLVVFLTEMRKKPRIKVDFS